MSEAREQPTSAIRSREYLPLRIGSWFAVNCLMTPAFQVLFGGNLQSSISILFNRCVCQGEDFHTAAA